MSKQLRLALIAGLARQLVEARSRPKRLKGRHRRRSSLSPRQFTKKHHLTATQKRKKRKAARISRARTRNWPRKGV